MNTQLSFDAAGVVEPQRLVQVGSVSGFDLDKFLGFEATAIFGRMEKVEGEIEFRLIGWNAEWEEVLARDENRKAGIEDMKVSDPQGWTFRHEAFWACRPVLAMMSRIDDAAFMAHVAEILDWVQRDEPLNRWTSIELDIRKAEHYQEASHRSPVTNGAFLAYARVVGRLFPEQATEIFEPKLIESYEDVDGKRADEIETEMDRKLATEHVDRDYKNDR